MPITVLEEKLKSLPESCFDELLDFMEYLEYKISQKKNGLDFAIEEEKNGEIEAFDSFENFKASMENQ